MTKAVGIIYEWKDAGMKTVSSLTMDIDEESYYDEVPTPPRRSPNWGPSMYKYSSVRNRERIRTPRGSGSKTVFAWPELADDMINKKLASENRSFYKELLSSLYQKKAELGLIMYVVPDELMPNLSEHEALYKTLEGMRFPVTRKPFALNEIIKRSIWREKRAEYGL